MSLWGTDYRKADQCNQYAVDLCRRLGVSYTSPNTRSGDSVSNKLHRINDCLQYCLAYQPRHRDYDRAHDDLQSLRRSLEDIQRSLRDTQATRDRLAQELADERAHPRDPSKPLLDELRLRHRELEESCHRKQQELQEELASKKGQLHAPHGARPPRRSGPRTYPQGAARCATQCGLRH
uniref:P21 n=1 Tax=Botryosphaeria dothidea botrexvirus 1 TaxID=2785370 RepID=A0A7T4X3N3_9VIRU|nr:P21 [Botryosphaeria dothidea botrexvirus 1]